MESVLADEILADRSQSCLSTKINSPPKFLDVPYLNEHYCKFVYISKRFQFIYSILVQNLTFVID